MNKIQRAVLFAAEKHKTQLRKGTNIPYIVHPIGVMEILMRVGASNDAIVAGILHDTIEDTNTTYDELRKTFGKRVADIVMAASESDKSLPWETRKKNAIAALRKCRDEDILAVIFADKTHNLQSIHHDWLLEHERVWNRFKHGEYDQLWYYGQICKIAQKKYKTVSPKLRTIMFEYWWEYDKFNKHLIDIMTDFGRMCAGIDREDWDPWYDDEFLGTTPWERLVGTTEKANEVIKKPTLLEQYHELAKQRGKDISSATNNEIVAKMKEIESKFTESDWNKLIKSSPVFMRPMINEQRKKYLKQK